MQDAPTDVRALQALGSAYVRRATQVADASFYDLAHAFDRADAVAQPRDTNLGRGLPRCHGTTSRRPSCSARPCARNPDNPDALAVMVDTQVELGRYNDAAVTLQDLLDRHPGLPAYARLSYVRELNGDTTGTLRAMRQADIGERRRLRPGDRRGVPRRLGAVRGDVDAAAQQYDRALSLAQPDLVLARVRRRPFSPRTW